MKKTNMRLTHTNKCYMASDASMIMRREWGRTPNGNDINGRWVLRDKNGHWIDFDTYSNDLAERWNLRYIDA